MINLYKLYGFFFCLLTFFSQVIAHQPVMDMAPRWKGGYGFQVRYELHEKRDLVKYNKKQANPLGLASGENSVWLEGIYTFTRQRRITVKLPYYSKWEKQANSTGGVDRFENAGFGDLIVASIHKKYVTQRRVRQAM